MRYRFRNFVLDTGRFELLEAGEPRPLQPKVFEVLRFLVEHADRLVTKEEIFEAVWPGLVTTEDSLTRAISLARRALGDSGESEGLIRTVRGRGYRFAAAVEVEPAAGGPPVEVAQPAVLPPRGRWALAVLLGLAGSMVLLAWPPSLATPPEAVLPAPVQTHSPRVAVLPFADLSQAGDQQYFADGISEAILNELARANGVAVIARTSSFAFRGSQDVREIGRRLSVCCVLEGSVRREGEALRVNARLVDAATGEPLWARAFEPRLEGVFDIQDEIARSVANSLERGIRTGDVRLAPPPDRPDVRAYELVLRARSAMRSETTASQVRAIELLEAALAIEPDYAEANSLLSRAYMTIWSNRGSRDAGLLRRATHRARRAVARDPFSAVARVGLADVLKGAQRWAAAKAELEHALALRPSDAAAHFQYSSLLMIRGRLADARAPAHRAVEIDPLSARNHRNLGRFFVYAGELDSAVAHLNRSLELDPDDPHAPRLLALAFELRGEPEAAREAYLRSLPASGRPGLRMAARVLGSRRSLAWSLRIQAALRGDVCRGLPYFTAIGFAYLGDEANMYPCLERAATEHLWYIRLEPVFDPYRDSPRFVEILEAAGFAG